ncbi:MAG: hypothetical protein HY704_02390 [Gemmatimonadetes bacterium]|nr:hypothetical protein [Gemmatimonadota bacterium]
MATPLLVLVAVGPAPAQRLEDFDYENLSFRGVGIDVGYIRPTKVEPTASFGARVDLGYLGPGVRILPGLSYWSSRLKAAEVNRLAERFGRSVTRQLPDSLRDAIGPIRVDLGRVEWTAVALGVDAQAVWNTPVGILTYAGLGASAHVLNGKGEFIDDTFVEDLLDAVQAGLNVHGGAELPLRSTLRLFGGVRFVLLEDVQYLTGGLGLQVMFGPEAPGEQGRANRVGR